MAICRHLGNPDLFITFTCNAKWPEIIEDLRERPGCKAEDRPDIISRIFKAKLDHMVKYIKSGKPFGKIESDRSLRDVLKGSKPGFDDLPFGGKPILFGGDFRQILPVVPNGTKADIAEASWTSSYLWPYLTIFFLKENMRLSKTGLNEKEKQELADFANWILQIGNSSVANSILSTDEENSWVEISKDFPIDFEDNLIENMVLAVYTDFQRNFHDVSYLKERAIVTPRNNTMTEINDFMLTKVPGKNRTYLSFDYVSSSTENVENLNILYPLEFLNQLDLPGLPHHKLALKV
ncbi:uncharacterized protein LOC125479931 [Pyrus x bretschneideri]|uniref:uncharacterized protein LOC125479931 n=1 Tax=Pyrus x bretschneideri TaxID=225117 RepID=UPI00203079C3|nr:uncharacterized protein LOC125479931 [Pyrus x bretschneideri]